MLSENGSWKHSLWRPQKLQAQATLYGMLDGQYVYHYLISQLLAAFLLEIEDSVTRNSPVTTRAQPAQVFRNEYSRRCRCLKTLRMADCRLALAVSAPIGS